MSIGPKLDDAINNSDVMRRTLFSLIFVARTKTTKYYAWSIIKNLIAELKSDYDFLKYIHIDEIEKLEDDIDDIKVISKFDQIPPSQIGQAVQEIVDIFRTKMGNKAGYFFLTEFKEILGERYYTVLKKMGVDLRLIDLQKEIYGWDSERHKIQKQYDSNIAYIRDNKD